MKKVKEDMLQTLSFLALRMENSGTELIDAIAPGTLAQLDSALTKEHCHIPENQLTKLEVKNVVQRANKVAKHLYLTNRETLLLIAAFNSKVQNDTFDWDDMRRFYNVKSMVLLPLKKDFDTLVNKKYFVPSPKRHSSDFELHTKVMESILEEKVLNCEDLCDRDYDRYKFVKDVSDLIENRSDGEITTPMLFDKADYLEQQHTELVFVQNIKKLNLNIDERTLLYEICDDFIQGGESGINCTLKDMYQNPSMRFCIAKDLKDEKHILQKLGYIELLPDSMFSDSHMALTEKGKQIFLEDDFDLFADTKRIDKSLIYPDKIAEKTMFYDKELTKQLELFKENLADEKFSELQKRLEEQALPKGVAALFHGLPGTGKTETAMQIARATGRAVCHVDISAAKTCWYGESQKRVKAIFTNYRKMCEKEKLKPILLFNEADALLSSRQNINNASGSSSVAQTENAIQNIILEEMENLDGILIATTNLTDNLDSAFARRFLFKIKFGQPTEEAKQSIWKDKLSWLTDDDCRQLAMHHDFSGGEIDNIVRKVVMEEVLHGARPTLAEIEELCKHEKIGDGTKGSIGFQA
ncbi:MAG: ATP-binding protein [Bacteroidales bacterium]|nr:ATP-binding protein [Bacteroidales bacterium]